MGARKDDIGKLRFDLVPVNSLRALAEVYTIGARKYSDRNWESGLAWGRIYAAMLRHATAWWGGEQLDKEDKQHHLASVAWCAFALMEYEKTHPEYDDRSSSNLAKKLDTHPEPYMDPKVKRLMKIDPYNISTTTGRDGLNPNELIHLPNSICSGTKKDCYNLKQGTDPSDDDVKKWQGGV